VRYHLCWGSWQGPHVHDLGLRDIVDRNRTGSENGNHAAACDF
jgi:hypothetical protein